MIVIDVLRGDRVVQWTKVVFSAAVIVWASSVGPRLKILRIKLMLSGNDCYQQDKGKGRDPAAHFVFSS